MLHLSLSEPQLVFFHIKKKSALAGYMLKKPALFDRENSPHGT